MGFFFNSSVIFCAKEQQEGDMWAPFHKNNFYRHKNIRENSKASTGRRDLEDLLSEFEDEDTSPYSDFFLSEPKTERLGYENIIIDDLEIGHSSIQGIRMSMEDSHLIKQTSLPKHVLVGVFDGHSGDETSEFLADNLLTVFESMEEWKAYTKLTPEARIKDTNLICKVFTQAFITLDQQLRDLDIKSGSTAVCSLITPSHIYTASVGDSRSVLGQRRGQAIGFSEDHKPELVDEKNRIVKAGGFVLYDRVNGELAMSRAMGDFQYKEISNLSVSEQMVICIPDIAVHERCDDDIVMVVACDGVFDVMTNLDVVDYLLTVVAETPDSDGDSSPLASAELADHIVDISLKLGSTDNISALVVKFLANPPLRTSTSNHKGALFEDIHDTSDEANGSLLNSEWNKKVKVSHVSKNDL